MSMFNNPALGMLGDVSVPDAAGTPSAIVKNDQAVGDMKAVLAAYASAFAVAADMREDGNRHRNAKLGAFRQQMLEPWADKDDGDRYLRELFKVAERLFKHGGARTGKDYRRIYQLLTGEQLPAE